MNPDLTGTPMRERAARRRLPVVSVRARLVAVITCVAVLGMAAVGSAVYVVEQTSIRASIDERLRAGLESARFLVGGSLQDPQAWGSAGEAAEDIVHRMRPDPNMGVVGVVGDRPLLLPGTAPDLDPASAPGFVPFALRTAAEGEPVIATYREPGLEWRFLVASVSLEGEPDPQPVHLVIAYDVDAELARINEPARVFLVAGGLVVAVVAVVGTLVAGRLLRPLRRMRETAEHISARSLSDRLPVQGRDDVSELAATMNAMLDRLDDALGSQRRLLHDVGHELKTPLTIVRGHLELMDAADPEEIRRTRTLALDELDRMSRLVHDLAAAAALHGPSPFVRVPVDTADLIDRIVRKAETVEGARVERGPIAPVVARLDPDRITQAVLQLVQNGATHGGGRLVIGSRADEGRLEISVRDHGPGVPEADVDRIFTRFYRGGGGRGPQGSGLGLPIVQVIARGHGGLVRVARAPGGGAVFTLCLPLDDAGPAAASSTTKGRDRHAIDPHRR